jgi:hypothetical protein
MNNTKPEEPQSEEFQRFQEAVKGLLSVTPQERKKIDAELEREAEKQKMNVEQNKQEKRGVK